MAVKSMHDLLVEELREIYDAERQAVRAYPRLIRAVASERLKEALQEHLEQTRTQVERIERAFGEMGAAPRAKSCAAVRGFVSDAEDRIRTGAPEALLDAALLAEAQKIEHFEIAAYGSAHAFAQALGLGAVAALLKETLEEEKTADKLLNQVALRDINKKALAAGAGAEPTARRGTARRIAAGRARASRGRAAAERAATGPARMPARRAAARRRPATDLAAAADKPTSAVPEVAPGDESEG